MSSTWHALPASQKYESLLAVLFYTCISTDTQDVASQALTAS
jgi:hypothetical protein